MARFQYFGPPFILPITGENKWCKSIQSPRCQCRIIGGDLGAVY